MSNSVHRIKEVFGPAATPDQAETRIHSTTLFSHYCGSGERGTGSRRRWAQKPIYYISKVLLDAETRYNNVEKYAYALITAAQKLRPYFQTYTIGVLTNQPLKKILAKNNHCGRLVAWSVELGEFDIQYKPCTAIKARALADFVVECTLPEEEITPDSEPREAIETWTLFVDGLSNASGCGAGLILSSPGGFLVQYALRFEFQTTNNGAEYITLIAGLNLAKSLMVRNITVHSDSQLVVNQVKGEYEAKEPRMTQYMSKVRNLITEFINFQIQQVPRAQNASADTLSRLATSEFQDLNRTVYVDVIGKPSIEEAEDILPIEMEPCWMDPLTAYLQRGSLPTDKEEVKKIRMRAARYTLIGGILYKKAYAMPYLKCLRPSEAEYVLREIHTGICRQHLGGIALAHKVIRQWYFWPYLHKEVMSYVRKCLKCQTFAPITCQPATELTSISSPLSFVQWGMDILVPFPKVSGGRQFVVVAMDYFTKWVEAKALAVILAAKVWKFFLHSIIYRYRILRTLITDNGKQFDQKFKEFSDQYASQLRKTSVAHP
ncbi:uncharacterized protein LOC122672260 [Telopea speciosissima]|uniref:uncharacterized protein LOC122672260 n=1 Tax=Telopea speciosissima TaxID=54955 RepID=UPI001CC51DD0|nr:uncharacterized protein LOC122672260 [Telopea speciosissima]